MAMTKRERVLAAIRGEPIDRVPMALWRHFPYVDQTAEGLACAVIDFQEEYDFDLVKVTPTSGYMAEAWGAELRHADNDEGTREYVRRPVAEAADWRRLPPLRTDDGILGREATALSLVRQAVGPDVFVLATIFSPLTVAKQLSGEAWRSHLRAGASDLHAGLARIAEVTVDFGLACLENGADAVFFATQLARRDILDEETYAAFGAAYDLPVLEALRPKAGLVLLHLHGLQPMFELAGRYPVDVVNWHDRETAPSLAEGLAMLRYGAVSGGLDHSGPIHRGSPEEAAAQVREAAREAGPRRLIVGTGCVLLTTSPPANIAAARRAANALTDASPVV